MYDHVHTHTHTCVHDILMIVISVFDCEQVQNKTVARCNRILIFVKHRRVTSFNNENHVNVV